MAAFLARRALALFAALALLGSVTTFARADDSPTPKGGTETPAAPPAAGGPATKPALAGPDAATREGVLKAIDSLREEVSEIRGLAWKKRVEADVLTRDQLREQMEEMMKEDLDPKDYDRAVKLLRRIGLLRADQDPLEIEKGFLSAGVAGFYNPKTKKLYVIDGLSVDAQRPTIFHELVHALEDQYIDLEKWQKDLEKDGDRLFAFKCCIEGSAEHARALYEARHPDVARLARKEQMAKQGDLLKLIQEAPGVLVLPTLLHYQIGPALVGRIVHDQYVAGIARAYGDFPCSQEQCLHPGKYCCQNRDLPRRFTWPKDLATSIGDGWTGLDVDTFGELDVTLWLDRWLGANDGHLDKKLLATGRFWSEAASKAAEGWDGAWFQVIQQKDEAKAFALASAWDSEKDAVEAAEAFEKALSIQYGSTWKKLPSPGDGKATTVDFTDSFGRGRIERRGDEVRILDGVPEAAFEKAWAALSGAPFERDPKDTWTPADSDLLSVAAWKNDAGIGWTPPGKDWAVAEGATPTKASFTHGDFALKATVVAAGFQKAALAQLGAIQSEHPEFRFDPTKMEELKVGGKDAGRLEFELGKGDARHSHVLYIVPLGESTLMLETDAPTASWPAASKDLATAISGFVTND
jgi:hypothetical protein